MKKQMKRRLISVLACVVVFITTYAMILPAITMTKDSQVLTCAAEIHRHDASCYEDVIEDGNVVGKRLICGKAGYVVHEHNADCYTEIDGQKVLVCTLPEIKEHKHGAECYEEQKILSCGLEESADHQHTDDCYTEEKVLICDQLELHEHDADCYEEGHEGDAAYLTCGKLELVEHTHGAACLEKAEQTDEQKIAAAKEAAQERLAFAESLESMSEYEAVPDGIAENEEEISEEVEAQIAEIEESAGEVKSASADFESTEEKPAPEYTATLTSDNGNLHVTAKISDIEEIPENAELAVTQLTPKMSDYDVYMSALNRGFDDDTYNSSNSLLYDVSVISGGDEYEPKDGNVDITIDFKKNQLTKDLGLDEEKDSALSIIHLPVNADLTKKVSDSELTPENINREVVGGTEVEMGKTESVSFSLDSLSVITVTGASTDVTVTGALQGTTMKSLDYNVYAYLVSETGGDAYGVKVSFVNGQFSGIIKGVPVDRYKLVLAYKPNNQALQEGKWNKNNVYECNVIENSGQYVFGYSSVMPADKTITASDNTIGFTLQVSEVQTNVNISTIMDRAINYGIVAESANLPNNCYTNFATKKLDIQNQNTQTYYGHRSDGIDVVPNIAAEVTNHGQPLTTENNQPANYYVTDQDKDKVNSTNQEETIVRNKNELEDRVEIMLSNTLKQAEELAKQSSVVLPEGLISVDVSPYGENATIVIDATKISKEQNGFTIVKRPGQTIVFNFNGQDVAPPQNTKIKLVDDNGKQIGNTYVAGDQMRNAPASDGDVWNKIIWNFPDATSVTATNQIGGIFLVPKGDFNAANKGGGWIVARGKVSVTNEWYGFPGSDEPFKQKIIRKTFVGIESGEIDANYALKLWTHTNESTSGTTQDQLISTLVLRPDSDESLVKDPSGVNDQTGYMTTGKDADGNVFYEWKTPSISVGNEHKLTEVHTESKGNEHLDLIEFVAPFSGWSDTARDYIWWQKEESYTSEQEFAGIFNVSSHNEDYRQYVYVTNHYNVEKIPHTLTLSKSVVDPEGLEQEGQKYTFQFTLKDEKGVLFPDQEIKYSINNAEHTVNVLNGLFTIMLKDGETVSILDLPYGAQYTIEEQEIPQKCEVSFSGDTTTSEKATGKLIKDRVVTATNTYADDPGVLITAHKDLVNGNLEDGQFTYKLVDENGRLIRQATNDANGNITFGTLIFDRDGEYDYRLYEVADLSMKDIVFDTRVYNVHLVVQGGRVRRVTYNGTGTTPMFRNEKINPSSDKLTARKMFVDADGKAIELQGDEFTFTATADDGTVYTGKNNANGMVTFEDSTGNEVDLDALNKTTKFTIAEKSGSYSGAVEEGQTLNYDNASYEATATVSTRTVRVNPVSIAANGKDNATVSVTFLPQKAGDKYYFKIPDGGASTVLPRDDGSVTFNIPISKNQTGIGGDYKEIQVEYGIGEFYNSHEKISTIVIRAKGGNWGQEEIEVDSVSVDGSTLSSVTRTEKTVSLEYKEGSYPVFINTLTKEQPDPVDFSFSKIWKNASDNPVDWPDNTTITVTLNASTEDDKKALDDVELSFGQTPESCPEGWTVTTSADGKKTTFYKDGLDATKDGKALKYYVVETRVSGYQNPSYADENGKFLINTDKAYNGQQIINTPEDAYELPSTGGPGTKLFTILGTLLVLSAGILLISRRRKA